MGSSFGSIHVRDGEGDMVRTACEAIAAKGDTKFLVAPIRGPWQAVYPSAAGQDVTISAALAERTLGVVVHVLLHDDDLFAYLFYRDGRLVDEYNSCPDYFGDVPEEEALRQRGRPELFVDILAPHATVAGLRSLLAAPRDTTAGALDEETADAGAAIARAGLLPAAERRHRDSRARRAGDAQAPLVFSGQFHERGKVDEAGTAGQG